MRHTSNLRYTERARPQRRQRVYSRVLYLAGRAWRTRWETLAMGLGGFLCGLGVGVALAGERHPEGLEQRVGLGVGLRARRDRHVEPADLVDRVVVDLGEDDLLADAERVVAAPVERRGLEAAEVADARDRDRHEPVEELVGALAPQRHGHADRHALADLELRDRLARAP